MSAVSMAERVAKLRANMMPSGEQAQVQEFFGSGKVEKPPVVENKAHSNREQEAQAEGHNFGAGNKGRAFELLSKGLSPIVVARTLEISPALISQFLAEEAFAEGVRAARAVRSTAVQVRDDKINALEDRALNKLGEVMDFITKPLEILQVVRTLNGLQRRAGGLEVGAGEDMGDKVVLQLPKHVVAAQVNLQFNTQNEVVEVSGRELRTMSSTQVLNNLLGSKKGVILEASAEEPAQDQRSIEHEQGEPSTA